MNIQDALQEATTKTPPGHDDQPMTPHVRKCQALAILEGDPDSVRWMLEEVKPEVSGFVLTSCWTDRSRRLAEDVVEEVFGECFGGYTRVGRRSRPVPLLLRFEGNASLQTWLKRIARNRLLSRLRTLEERMRAFPLTNTGLDPDYRKPLHGEMSKPDGYIPVASPFGSGAEHPLQSAMISALRETEHNNPEDFVLLKLYFLHGVAKSRLAIAWQVEPSTIGRRIERSITSIRRKVRGRICQRADAAPYELEDFLEAGCEAVLASEGTSSRMKFCQHSKNTATYEH